MRYWTSISVIIALGVMAFCSYYLYREFTFRVEKTGGEVIGTVTFKKRIASRRYSDNVVWEEIGEETEIYNHDAIRTLEYSSAVISLKDGTKIELDQNTLLVVMLSEKGLNINFDRGGVSARSAAGGGRPVTLNTRDAVVQLEEGDMAVNSSEGSTDIVVSKGEAIVESGGREIELSPDKIATIKDGKIESKKNTLFPEKPGQNAYILTPGGKARINFSWRSEPEGSVKVEISANSSFAGLAESFSSAGMAKDVMLSPGDYYWRIVRGGTKSYPVKFTVISDKRPVPIYPRENQEIALAGDEGVLNFRWDGGEHVSGYEITAARDIGMKDVVVKLQSRVNTISARGISPGVYYWSVRNIYPPGIDGGDFTAGPVRFKVDKRSFSLTRPELFEIGPVTTGGSFVLNWKGVNGAERYFAEISSDSEFKKNVISRYTVNSFLRVNEKLPEGSYFWRVSALKGENSSGSSTVLPLVITKPVEIVTVHPERGQILYKRPEVINFRWNDPNKGKKYLVEISEKNDFRKIIMRLESDAGSVTGETPGAGAFFWRVLLKDGSGKVIAKSAASGFSIPAELRAPVLITPGQNEKVVPGLKNRIRFEWKKIRSANEYEVEVFQRIAGADRSLIVYTSKSSYVEASNISLFRPGKFSWLVRAKRVRNGRVTAYRESGKSIFAIEDVRILPPPEVKDPGVLFK